jgi:hypothetical protein
MAAGCEMGLRQRALLVVLSFPLAGAFQRATLSPMRSETIASKLLVGRIAPLALCATSLVACGSSPPAQSPNEVDNAPPTAAGTGAAPAAPPSSIAGDLAADAKKNKFDEEQARIVLTRAANNAHTCVNVVDKDQPHGDGTVTVTFSGKGKSTNATMAAPFEGTPMGQCATRAFVNIIIPPFEGPDVDVAQQVNLKPDSKAAKKDSTNPKK